MNSPETYIPYEATAHAEVSTGHDAEFIQSVFPDAQPEDLVKMLSWIEGRVHDGIEYGLALSDGEPMRPVESYQFGVDEGYEKAIDDINRMRGQQ